MTKPSFNKTVRVATAETGWGIDANSDVDLTPDMFLGDIGFFQFQPVGPTLLHLSIAVANTLQEFRTFYDNRG